MKQVRSVILPVVSCLAFYVCLIVFFNSGAFLSLLDFCTGSEMKVTEEQVEERIKSELPNRATQSEVEAFVDSLTINNLKAIRYEYRFGEPGSTSMDAPEIPHPQVKGHILSRILDVGYDGLVTYEMRIVFFFDKNERLIAHHTRVFGDGL